MNTILIAILSGVFSSGFTIAAIKIDLGWIKDTLKVHDKYHNHHFKEIGNLKVKVAENA